MTQTAAVLAEMLRSVEQHELDELPYCRESLRMYYGDMADHPEVTNAIARRRAELMLNRAHRHIRRYGSSS